MGGRGSSGLRASGGERFKTFNAMMEDGKRYQGDGADAVAFFGKNSNYNALISQMSDEERNDFHDFVAGIFMYNKGKSLDANDQRRQATYDKYLGQATLSEGVEVKRLTDWSFLGGAKTAEQLSAMQGQVITSKYPLSTGAAGEGLLMYSNYKSKPVEINYKIPPSTGAGMWIGDTRINPTFGAKQREFMLNRNTDWKVGKSHFDSKRGITVIDMEFVGKTSRRKH